MSQESNGIQVSEYNLGCCSYESQTKILIIYINEIKFLSHTKGQQICQFNSPIPQMQQAKISAVRFLSLEMLQEASSENGWT